MNERTPPPKLENIAAAIKFTVTGPDQFGKSRLVASLNVGSSCWFSDGEAKKHPEVMTTLREKLKHHLLRQLYGDQRHEMYDAISDFMKTWHPVRGATEAFDARDKVVALAAYSPPAGFGEEDCDRGPNCGCEQFEFLLQPSTRKS